MSFRDREKDRIIPLKPKLFTPEACQAGMYKKKFREFCLPEDKSGENLHSHFREAAIKYFEDRNIPWHDGREANRKNDRPSNHLCCSQSACVNFWFAFCETPDELAGVLCELGYDVAEMLPMTLDEPLEDGMRPYVSFEWIGEKNYLAERLYGEVAPDHKRKRGAGFTSADFAFRFRQSNGAIQIVLGEWKYTECYAYDRCIRHSGKTDRLTEIYEPFLEKPDCQIQPGDIGPQALFYDPFDQLMRLQLLATEMESAKEMDADIVSVLHVAPAPTAELMARITSPGLEGLGADVHKVWIKLVPNNRFKGVILEQLLPLLLRHAPNQEWAEYLLARYGGMA